MEQEMDIRTLFGIIRKRFVWLLVLPIIAVIASGLISFYLLTPMYEATTTLLVGRASDGGPMGYQDLMLNRQLISTYAEIAKSRSVAESVITALRLDISASELAGLINVTSIRDTEIIAISVQNANPIRAKRIANQVAKSFSDKVVGYSNVDNVMVVDVALTPRNPVSPNIRLNLAIAGVLGIMLAIGLILLVEFLDNTIKSPADIEQLLGLTVMATVPLVENGKGGR